MCYGFRICSFIHIWIGCEHIYKLILSFLFELCRQGSAEAGDCEAWNEFNDTVMKIDRGVVYRVHIFDIKKYLRIVITW